MTHACARAEISRSFGGHPFDSVSFFRGVSVLYGIPSGPRGCNGIREIRTLRGRGAVPGRARARASGGGASRARRPPSLWGRPPGPVRTSGRGTCARFRRTITYTSATRCGSAFLAPQFRRKTGPSLSANWVAPSARGKTGPPSGFPSGAGSGETDHAALFIRSSTDACDNHTCARTRCGCRSGRAHAPAARTLRRPRAQARL